MNIERLARAEIAALHAYVTAAQQPNTVRLNANEAPNSPLLPATSLHRYPSILADAITERLADLYGVDPGNLLVTRGSSEAIDLLIRTFCRAYSDSIVTTPPTFAMYGVYADMQAASNIKVPLDSHAEFALDSDSVVSACTDNTKLVFLCSPNNPTGGLLERETILTIARERAGKSLVVVDEAYIDFSASAGMTAEIAEHDNLVILRTLSKAYGLAGTRCGSVTANAAVIRLLATMLPPYAFSTPATECVLEALSANAQATVQKQIATTIQERERVQRTLAELSIVEHISPSSSNFLLVRFTNLTLVMNKMKNANILIRSFANDELLQDCARITIGSTTENDLLLDCLRELAESGT